MKPDISDLRAELIDACRRTGGSEEDKRALGNVLAKVRDRYGDEAITNHAISVYGTCWERHNATIDFLDRDYPDWRGYVPHYLAQRSCAA
jgi:5-methylcytosine-specific restriction endonuclease McrBC regulatory subunit McrC